MHTFSKDDIKSVSKCCPRRDSVVLWPGHLARSGLHHVSWWSRERKLLSSSRVESSDKRKPRPSVTLWKTDCLFCPPPACMSTPSTITLLSPSPPWSLDHCFVSQIEFGNQNAKPPSKPTTLPNPYTIWQSFLGFFFSRGQTLSLLATFCIQ